MQSMQRGLLVRGSAEKSWVHGLSSSKEHYCRLYGGWGWKRCISVLGEFSSSRGPIFCVPQSILINEQSLESRKCRFLRNIWSSSLYFHNAGIPDCITMLSLCGARGWPQAHVHARQALQTSLANFFVCLVLFWDRALLCNFGYPGSYFIARLS